MEKSPGQHGALSVYANYPVDPGSISLILVFYFQNRLIYNTMDLENETAELEDVHEVGMDENHGEPALLHSESI